jgi:uncharacterized protein YaiI (UPF0178 family)
MRILVDADACPNKDEIEKICIKYKIELLLFMDYCHVCKSEYAKVFIIDKGKDSVDIALINKTNEGDLVITQDYGLAVMALGKKAKALNPKGFFYSEENMDRLLFERYLGQKERRKGNRSGKNKKRKSDDTNKFINAIISWIES